VTQALSAHAFEFLQGVEPLGILVRDTEALSAHTFEFLQGVEPFNHVMSGMDMLSEMAIPM
jgi:hypothetical protein